MNTLKAYLAAWPVCVLWYVVAHLIVFGGTALTLYLWAAPLDDWPATLERLFWRSFLYSAPLGLMLSVSSLRRRMRDRSLTDR